VDNCNEYMELISAYADGELPEPDKQKVEEHLLACPDCSSILQAYREISLAVEESCVPAPEALCAGVMERVKSDSTTQIAKNMKKFKTVNIILTRYIPLAACLVFLLLTVPRLIGIGRYNSSTNSGGAELSSYDSGMQSAPSGAPELGGGAFAENAMDEDSGVYAEEANRASAGAAPEAPAPAAAPVSGAPAPEADPAPSASTAMPQETVALNEYAEENNTTGGSAGADSFGREETAILEEPELQAQDLPAPEMLVQAESEGSAALVAPTGPVVLTIKGDGVNGETTWALNQLQAMSDGYRELVYSTTNNWPTFSYAEAHGISLPYLLRQAGMNNNAASFKLTANDGYNVTLTYDQVFGTHYTYTSHSPSGSSGAIAIEPIIAWAWGDVGKVRDENIRPHFGQSGPYDVNTAFFVKDLCLIEVSTASAGNWAAPEASIASGATVPAGTELELLHGSMDSVRIYYTLDGSEPDFNSVVYNPSASYYQPDLTKPLVLTQSVTIKVFAAAYGKDRSPVAVFSYTVDK